MLEHDVTAAGLADINAVRRRDGFQARGPPIARIVLHPRENLVVRTHPVRSPCVAYSIADGIIQR
jgi:hypothetical protein